MKAQKIILFATALSLAAAVVVINNDQKVVL